MRRIRPPQATQFVQRRHWKRIHRLSSQSPCARDIAGHRRKSRGEQKWTRVRSSGLGPSEKLLAQGRSPDANRRRTLVTIGLMTVATRGVRRYPFKVRIGQTQRDVATPFSPHKRFPPPSRTVIAAWEMPFRPRRIVIALESDMTVVGPVTPDRPDARRPRETKHEEMRLDVVMSLVASVFSVLKICPVRSASSASIRTRLSSSRRSGNHVLSFIRTRATGMPKRSSHMPALAVGAKVVTDVWTLHHHEQPFRQQRAVRASGDRFETTRTDQSVLPTDGPA